MEIDRSQHKLGPIWLSAGVLPRNAVALFYSAALSIVFVTFLNLMHPYLLREHLGMPSGVQGDFTGNMYVYAEIMSLGLMVPLGVLSDRVGRRRIFAVGFLIVSLGLVLLPTATSGTMLIVYRVLTSAGIACCTTMTSSVMADYPQNATRGKFIGANGVITAFAIVGISAFGLARLPEFFAARGYDTVAAGNATYWIAGSLALASAFICFAGLKDAAFLKVEARTGLLNKARNGLAEILRNSRLSLGCGATFVSRGDLTVLAAFFSLWLINVGTDMGMETGEAATKAGMLFGLSQIVVPFFVPIVAIAVDRIDRVTTLAMAMALAAGGYFALGLVPNPLESWLIYPAAIVTGLGEAAVIISTPALVGQEAPAKMRGSIIGVVALSGALGVLVNIKVSGLLFDNWMYQGPFIYMGFLNVAIAVWAVLVRVATK